MCIAPTTVQGKTTIARIVANVLRDIDILKGQIVEVGGAELLQKGHDNFVTVVRVPMVHARVLHR